MPIPKEIIDNSEGNKLISFLNNVLRENPKTNFDIATAFFNIQAFAMIKDNLNGVERFRLLLGKTPEIQNETTLGDVLLKEIRKEIEGFDLTKEQDKTIKLFIEFLKRKNVEIRLFEKFLHGKAYIFDDRIVIGSSNFTAAGLTRYGELNTWKQKSQAIFTRKEWFEKFWAESRDFKDELIEILENSRFGSKEYLPYDIYIKTLYEFQKDDVVEEGKNEKPKGLPETKVNLAQFQDAAIERIWKRLRKYGGCIVADSVGLGKTWIAKKILERIGYYERKNILIICPAQLMGMWAKEMKKIDVKENILSQENLASENFLEKAKKTLGGRFDDVELIVVDESHNFRNPLSNRWENFFALVNDNIAKKGKKPYMLFLTATPINNTLWDLYWQIMLLILMDRSSFIKENIPDLFKFFKQAKDNPSLLNDLLNEISIRRTRDYIIKNYPDAYIEINGEQKKIIFPERVLENINYQLDNAYKGMYKEISDIISNLKMAYYHLLEYKEGGVKTEEEMFVLNRMIQIGGIFRTILFKRLESSVESFRISIKRHIDFLEKLKKSLKAGKILGKKDFSKLLKNFGSISEEDIEEYLDKFESLEGTKLDVFEKDLYKIEDLFRDIDKDIKLLSKILEKVNTIKPEDDSKLNVLKDKLLNLSKDGQIVLFTYYADTLNYIYNEIIKDKKFSKLKIEAVSSSGLTNKNPQQREKIIEKFFKKEIDILMSTDVLSQGQNLQTAKYLINYDLHWNPTRMIQRAGRIDRIGSPYKKIFVYNFFPEDELEELLKLVEILQNKIIDIDKSVGLDQTILGEEIHPKVFGIIRKIKGKDPKIFAEVEQDAFGGGEKFYQPLKDFMKNKALEELEKIPYGVYSGLKKNKISGIFFYYKYGKDFHFWYLYDINTDSIITSKTKIIDFIACKQKEVRVIPNFFEKIYEVNRTILNKIEEDYNEVYSSQKSDTKFKEHSESKSSTFVKKMANSIEKEINDYLEEFPSDNNIQRVWDITLDKLQKIPLTKKRLQILRRIWKQYKKEGNWKKRVEELNNFLMEKGIFKKPIIEPFDKSKLQLVTIDFIS